MTDPNRYIFNAAGEIIHDRGEPAEVRVARLVQHLVLDQLTAGRKLAAGSPWVQVATQDDQVTAVKINIYFQL
jgi:hypothetical protein